MQNQTYSMRQVGRNHSRVKSHSDSPTLYLVVAEAQPPIALRITPFGPDQLAWHDFAYLSLITHGKIFPFARG